jgi:hypothetical protein
MFGEKQASASSPLQVLPQCRRRFRTEEDSSCAAFAQDAYRSALEIDFFDSNFHQLACSTARCIQQL